MRWLLLLALAGCHYRVQVESRPTGALVEVETGEAVYTPDELVIRWQPLRTQRASVAVPGYRTLEDVKLLRVWDYPFDVLLHPREALGVKPRRRVEFVMVPVHGPAGTWTPEGEDLE